MQAIQEQIEQTEDVGRFLEPDRSFHLGTYAGCPEGELLSTVTRLKNSTQHFRRAFMLIGGADRRWFVNAEHHLILDAVDGERYLAGHIRRTRIQLAQHPRSSNTEPVATRDAPHPSDARGFGVSALPCGRNGGCRSSITTDATRSAMQRRLRFLP